MRTLSELQGCIMTTEQHRAIAQWHNQQADLHEEEDGHSCGCPVDHHQTKTNSEILQEMNVEHH